MKPNSLYCLANFLNLVWVNTLFCLCVLQDDEYVVYNTDQVRLKYVVQFSLPEDQMKTFQPWVDMSVEPEDLTNSNLCECLTYSSINSALYVNHKCTLPLLDLYRVVGLMFSLCVCVYVFSV